MKYVDTCRMLLIKNFQSKLMLDSFFWFIFVMMSNAKKKSTIFKLCTLLWNTRVADEKIKFDRWIKCSDSLNWIEIHESMFVEFAFYNFTLFRIVIVLFIEYSFITSIHYSFSLLCWQMKALNTASIFFFSSQIQQFIHCGCCHQQNL